MRDLINILDKILTEETLGASQMPAKKMSGVKLPDSDKFMSRQQLFLYKVQKGSPFTTKQGESVTIDPSEADKVATWFQQGMPKPISLTTTTGETVKNTELQKTVEFGSKEAEQIKLKGSDVFDTGDVDVEDMGNKIEDILGAGGFPVIYMYEVLSKSPQIKKLGKIGTAILDMANQIINGNVPTFPKGLTAQEIKAIELYASEYLGVLGLAARIVPFKQGNREEFDEFMGKDMGELIVYFPKSVRNPLADSFSVTNDETGHSIKISSKAAGKGAPPSLTSLKLPADVREKYPEAAEFIDSAQDPSVSTFAQPFIMMNSMAEVNPNAVPTEYTPLLPFSDELISQLESTVKSNKKMPEDIMDIFYSRLSKTVQDSDNTDGGKAWYAVTTDIINAVNKDSAVPNLREALIESLGYNFVQLYTNVRGDKLVTDAFWPAKLRGNVKLKTKGSASDPKKGKLSVEISPGKESANIPIGNIGSEKDTEDEVDFSKAAKNISKGTTSKIKPKSDKSIGDIGREKRKK